MNLLLPSVSEATPGSRLAAGQSQIHQRSFPQPFRFTFCSDSVCFISIPSSRFFHFLVLLLSSLLLSTRTSTNLDSPFSITRLICLLLLQTHHSFIASRRIRPL
ncbi:hypothetical protein M431DRAFT_388738 [Trichoderma harzianum CBS 226.95]|uniref:Uncharacterized protein n=1 Tax=Trichoderma harzianum CBS 226.95 TaxID=983964 RepID=A0A2T4AJ05_TRIHA|nr:hypothetical protein M431DRAFT_388738 [Trichoderma harzianum CBS 226.95]PTB56898.1 hypothetical protein M431DRAFT_388738 [Trichoderma harzianum CBS 226.95]